MSALWGHQDRLELQRLSDTIYLRMERSRAVSWLQARGEWRGKAQCRHRYTRASGEVVKAWR